MLREGPGGSKIYNDRVSVFPLSHDTLRPLPHKAIPGDRRVLRMCDMGSWVQRDGWSCVGGNSIEGWEHRALTDTVTAPTFQEGMAGISSSGSILLPGSVAEARECCCSAGCIFIMRTTDINQDMIL